MPKCSSHVDADSLGGQKYGKTLFSVKNSHIQNPNSNPNSKPNCKAYFTLPRVLVANDRGEYSQRILGARSRSHWNEHIK